MLDMDFFRPGIHFVQATKRLTHRTNTRTHIHTNTLVRTIHVHTYTQIHLYVQYTYTHTQIHLYVQIRSTNTYIYIYLHRTLYTVHYTPTKYILHDISYNCTGLYQIVVYRLVLYCIVLYLYHIVLYWRVSNHSVLYCSEYCVGRSYNIQCIVLYCFVYGVNHTVCRSCRLVAASHSLRLQTLYR